MNPCYLPYASILELCMLQKRNVSVAEENNWMHHQWLDMAAFSASIILLLNWYDFYYVREPCVWYTLDKQVWAMYSWDITYCI